MVTTEPLIGARIPDQSDGPLGGLQVANAARDIIPYAVPRFTSVAARDTAYAAWVTTGGTLADGMCCSTAAEGVLWYRLDGVWRDLHRPASGKMWKIGTQALTTSLAKVTMDDSRVSGGITFSNTNDELTLALDGFHEVIIRGSVSGASGPLGYFACQRTRAAVADVRWTTAHFDKPDASDRAINSVDVVPLKAGDKLSLQVVSGVAVAVARGANEYDGCVLTATWVGPLNGATPI